MEDSIIEPKHGDPPAYVDESCLQTFTVVQNTRYDRKLTAQPVSLVILPGVLLNIPQYSPSEWVEHINPEGARYYVNSIINTITDTPIDRPELYEWVSKGFQEIQGIVANTKMTLPQGSEIFIQVQEMQGDKGKRDNCNYYLVDHDTQTEFWVHPINPSQLNMPQVTSERHLKYVLQEHYWNHVEYFPHRPIAMKSREELISILRHGQLDVMTSISSTFPYTVEQCEKYIKLLADSMTIDQDIYTTCMTARIWSQIAHYHYDNFFGEDYARLDRDHYVFGEPAVARPYAMTILSALLFGIPSKINRDLETLFVDDTVYGTRWQKFIRSMVDSWKDSRLFAVLLVIVNAIFLTEPKGLMSTYIGLASVLCSIASVIGSLALLQKYTGAEDHIASQALQEMCQLEHNSLRFQPAAALFSVPKALITWSIILLTTEVFSLLLEFSTTQAAIIMAIVFAIFLAIGLVGFIIRRGINIWHRHRSLAGQVSKESKV